MPDGYGLWSARRLTRLSVDLPSGCDLVLEADAVRSVPGGAASSVVVLGRCCIVATDGSSRTLKKISGAFQDRTVSIPSKLPPASPAASNAEPSLIKGVRRFLESVDLCPLNEFTVDSPLLVTEQ